MLLQGNIFSIKLNQCPNLMAVLFAIIVMSTILSLVPYYRNEIIIFVPISVLILTSFFLLTTKNLLRTKIFMWSKTEMFLPVLVLAFSGIVSIINAFDIVLSLRSIFLCVIVPSIFYFLVVSEIKTIEGTKRAVLYVSVVAFFTALISLYRIYMETGFTTDMEILRYYARAHVGGLFHSTNIYAAFGILVLPIVFCMAFFKPDQNFFIRLFLELCFLVIILTIFATFSRMAWIACIFSLFVVLILYRRIGLVLVSLLVLILVSVYFFNTSIFAKFRGSQAVSDLFRVEIYKTSVDLAMRHPIVGVGIGNFEIASNYLAPTAHNSILGSVAERGILGLFGFVFFVYRSLKIGITSYRSSVSNDSRLISLGLLLGVSNTIIYSLTTGCGFEIYENDITGILLFWGFLGLLEGNKNINGSRRIRGVNSKMLRSSKVMKPGVLTPRTG